MTRRGRGEYEPGEDGGRRRGRGLERRRAAPGISEGGEEEGQEEEQGGGDGWGEGLGVCAHDGPPYWGRRDAFARAKRVSARAGHAQVVGGEGEENCGFLDFWGAARRGGRGGQGPNGTWATRSEQGWEEEALVEQEKGIVEEEG